MLKPLGQNQSIPQPVMIMRTCELCGKQIDSSYAINMIFVIGSPGHPSLAPFQCEHEEHWACCLDHWRQVAHACIDEHMHELLKQKHGELNGTLSDTI